MIQVTNIQDLKTAVNQNGEMVITMYSFLQAGLLLDGKAALEAGISMGPMSISV